MGFVPSPFPIWELALTTRIDDTAVRRFTGNLHVPTWDLRSPAATFQQVSESRRLATPAAQARIACAVRVGTAVSGVHTPTYTCTSAVGRCRLAGHTRLSTGGLSAPGLWTARCLPAAALSVRGGPPAPLVPRDVGGEHVAHCADHVDRQPAHTLQDSHHRRTRSLFHLLILSCPSPCPTSILETYSVAHRLPQGGFPEPARRGSGGGSLRTGAERRSHHSRRPAWPA